MKPYVVIEWDGSKDVNDVRVFETGIQSSVLAEKAVEKWHKKNVGNNSNIQYVSHSQFCFLFETEPALHKKNQEKKNGASKMKKVTCPKCGAEDTILMLQSVRMEYPVTSVGECGVSGDIFQASYGDSDFIHINCMACGEYWDSEMAFVEEYNSKR